ncbi:hypothetical protein AVEN_99822-1 [Araneus ventricosus]|uniref:Uncharacterized protein n=1 Tax=Araneus ventricosus TaxID=182803 RepID=A0A4Y2KC75_ARAVE|nr:hypothetical protein AVEN_259357-1 [Araneus ventricosus]GBN00294.1 hypothetical protein AVEN_99822-1 [Araneus ventricosus]
MKLEVIRCPELKTESVLSRERQQEEDERVQYKSLDFQIARLRCDNLLSTISSVKYSSVPSGERGSIRRNSSREVQRYFSKPCVILLSRLRKTELML